MSVKLEVVNTKTVHDPGYDVKYYDINLNDVNIGQINLIVEAGEPVYVEKFDIDPEYQNIGSGLFGYGTQALYKLADIYRGILFPPDNIDDLRLCEQIGTISDYGYAHYIDRGYGVYSI